MSEQYAPTDLTLTVQGSGVYSGRSETDIVYQKGSLPGGFVGMTWCDDSVGGGKCDQHYVRFLTSSPPYTDVCHESGHGVGLTHGKNASPRKGNNDRRLGCMVTPDDINGLGAHNKAMINSTY
jgi:hypothetical protein